MTVKSVVVALGILASAGLAAGAQAKPAKKPVAKASDKAAVKVPANLHFTVAPTGNEARYRVREQLVGIDFPSDAVGKTSEISGTLVVTPDGKIIADSSKITLNAQSLKSDKTGRDNSLKTQAIETAKYPTITFEPKSFSGLNEKFGATEATFTVTGDLTVHGKAHSVTFDVKAHRSDDDVLGTATTKFTFQSIGMDPPSKAIVLKVMDTIKLEYDLHLVLSPTDKKP